MPEKYSGRGNPQENGKTRPPGRPRSEQARLSVLRSALKLLAKKGFSALTIEAVAAHANVAKATVYRWWPDKATLIADAFAGSTQRHLHFPDTGSVQNDMCQQMQQLVKVFCSPRGKIVSAMLGAGQSDHSLIAAFNERFLKPRRQEAYATLRRGIERGQLSKNIDMDLLLDSLYGPIYMRFLIRHDKLTAEFVEGICELALGSGHHSGKSLNTPVSKR